MARDRQSLRQLTLRILEMTGAALLIVLVYRTILHVNSTTVALTFLVMVQLAAFAWGLACSIYLSILCTLLYNFFFLPPIGSLTINDPQNLVALLAFLASAILISRIAESERRQAEVSENRRREVERLYEFSQQLLMEERLHELAHNAPRTVAAIFGFSCVALYLAENDAVYFSDPQKEFVSIHQLRAASQAPEAPRFPLQEGRIVPLMLGMRATGAVAMVEGAYSDGLYDAIAGLLAIALERAAALERFGRVEAAREGERLRSALLDSVTHELRTPLTAIRAAATSLLSQPFLAESERREMFSVVDEESARLDRLIGRAVEMAQLDTTGVELRLRPERLREVIENALEEARALLRGREVSVELPENLPVVSMDGALIRRVLRHVLENAARYSPPGSPVFIDGKLHQGRLLVSIRDEGQGIDEAEQPFIFDKFYRGGRQNSRPTGTGMGLAIARAILRAHGGGIDVVSHPNQGATFTFWIPVKES